MDFPNQLFDLVEVGVGYLDILDGNMALGLRVVSSVDNSFGPKSNLLLNLVPVRQDVQGLSPLAGLWPGFVSQQLAGWFKILDKAHW